MDTAIAPPVRRNDNANARPPAIVSDNKGFWIRAQRFGRDGDSRAWLTVGYRDSGAVLPRRLIDVADRQALKDFALAAEDASKRALWNDPRARGAAYSDRFALLTDAAIADSFAPVTPRVGEAKETAALPWHTAREVSTATPERPDWIARPYLVRGEITGIAGKLKVGKSTLTAHLVRAVLTGGTFLGEPCRRGPVLLLTEQRTGTLRELFDRVGLLDRDDLHVLHLNDIAATPWPEVAAAAVVKASAVGATCLVVDTISRWARIADENDAAAFAAAVTPLEDAAANGIGVWTVQHERKSGGSIEDAGRGSSAFGGAVDILLRLRRGEGATPRTVRILEALSRFDDTPEQLAIELVDSAYIVRGTEGAVRRQQAREQVDAVLTEASLRDAGPMTLAALKERLPAIKDDTLRKALEDSVQDGHAVRDGTGKRGDPYLWRVSFAPVPPRVAVAKETAESSGEAEVSFATPILGVQKQKKRPDGGADSAQLESIDASGSQTSKAEQRPSEKEED